MTYLPFFMFLAIPFPNVAILRVRVFIISFGKNHTFSPYQSLRSIQLVYYRLMIESMQAFMGTAFFLFCFVFLFVLFCFVFLFFRVPCSLPLCSFLRGFLKFFSYSFRICSRCSTLSLNHNILSFA